MAVGELQPTKKPADPLVGRVLSDRYRVIKKLGEGGMGAVYLAEHVFIEKKVALKVLALELASEADLTARFLQEANSASRIGHENVIEISDFGQTPEGFVFFAMECLDGADLGDILRKEGALPWKRARPILLQICKALRAAHQQGIIHRDMKPENVFLIEKEGRKDFVKLLDFGIAQVQKAEGPRLTKTGMIFGTPEYMAPEQAEGKVCDQRADIYAMGCVMYHVLTGSVPFFADNFMVMLTKHLVEEAVKPSVRRPDLHILPAIDDVIMAALVKNRDKRTPNMDAFIRAIEAVPADPVPAAAGPGARAQGSVKNLPTKQLGGGEANVVRQAVPETVGAKPQMLAGEVGAGRFGSLAFSNTEVTPSVKIPPGSRTPDSHFAVGDIVADRYRVVRFLAEGGMGQVYEAYDLELDVRIALKTVRPEISADRRIIESFKREIYLSRKVTHPNVCRIFDVGFHGQGNDGDDKVSFLTMEFLDGETLKARLGRSGRMTTTTALPFVQQMASALAVAHRAGVIHRDFKSLNVMLVAENHETRAVVADFGLARPRSDEEAVTTTASGMRGTPAYMAPEQVAGLEVTAAADIYALGVVMYEMVTGTYPFLEATPELTAIKRLQMAAPSPRTIVKDLDPVWEAVILRCLERKPADRFASADEVLVALSRQKGDAGKPHVSARRVITAAIFGVTAVASLLLAQRLFFDPVATPTIERLVSRQETTTSHATKGTNRPLVKPLVAPAPPGQADRVTAEAAAQEAAEEATQADPKVEETIRAKPAAPVLADGKEPDPSTPATKAKRAKRRAGRAAAKTSPKSRTRAKTRSGTKSTTRDVGRRLDPPEAGLINEYPK